MKPTTKAQNQMAIAEWYGIALMFPQKHPQDLAAVSAYTTRYGATPDGSESAPWMYQQEPATVTPETWKAPLTVPEGKYYDPRTGQVYPYGSDPNNNLDPTAPAFVEPQPPR